MHIADILQNRAYLLILMFFGFAGCERIIDLDLNETRSALVIEGDLSYPDGQLIVNISRTGSYFENEPLHKVEGASVYLENRYGIKEKVPEAGKGVYKLEHIQVEPGDEFKLMVEVDGVDYSASSTVKPPVEIDSVSYTYYAGDSFFRPGYRFNVSFYDPPEKRNYYRIRVYKNRYLFNRPNDLVVFDDTDMDGSLINVRLHSQYYVEKGESIVLELMSIDRWSWEYFTSLREIVNAGPGSPAPANPVSNFSNGAMGYFYAWSYSRKTVIIEK